jgi:hypothetical protein
MSITGNGNLRILVPTIIPAMLAPDFEILGHFWSVNDAIAIA